MEHRRAWIYCRVAYPDAFALAAQQASLEAYAEKQGFEIVGITAEQASGLDFSRRGLAEVSGAVAAGEADLLLVEDQFVEVVCADGTTPQTSTEILLAMMKESGISLNKVR